MATKVRIRHPELTDCREFLARSRASRSLHHPWVTPPTSIKQFGSYVRRMQEPGNFAFLVCHPQSQAIAGIVNVTNAVLGPFRSAYLGYYAFTGFERQGFMRAGLQAVVQHAFKRLKLHRLEANIQPGNVASIALVRACGFAKEGYSPRYLKIGGRWRDHERWAILAS
jgi:[ribosomal protein S5]-alanine N-acetyltransferase